LSQDIKFIGKSVVQFFLWYNFFAMNFQCIGFASQLEENEIVVRSFRRAFSPVFLRLLMWGFLFGILGLGIWRFMPRILPLGNESRWLVVFVIVFGMERLLRVFWKWYGNVILMTNESLVFAEWKGFFDRRTVRLDYWDLGEVGLERKGVVSFFVGIGDLVFEKISGGAPHIFKKVSNPKRAVKILRHHKGRMLEEKNFTEESALRNLLSQMVQTHVRANGQPLRERREETQVLSGKKEESDEEEMVEVDFELDDDGGIEIQLKD
jgi:hypothetical protein